VYGYVVRRVESPIAAEDITAETFLSAMATLRRGTAVDLSMSWLIGVARHKVVDHWRRQASDHRRIEAATQQADSRAQERANADAWDAVLDATLAHETLAKLSANHRAALTLRYLDGLPVGEIAHHLNRTIGATEALLTRAKAAFRTAYPASVSTSNPKPKPGASHA
jgi:RNA polymerase sigma-70 factor (ECF subfamily)